MSLVEDIESLVSRFGIEDLMSNAVLIVDDDAPNLDVLASVLEDDYTVHKAESGSEALKVLEANPLDVIIADQRMPEMTGVELLERVSRDRPDIAGILLTAYTDSDTIIAAINRAGAFRFLTKPWEPYGIRIAVAQAMKYVYQRRALERLLTLLTKRNEELRKALEDLEAAQERMLHLERLSTLGRLTAGIAHDLRNFIMGLNLIEEEFDRRDDLDEGLRETVRVGLMGLRNLTATLDTLREFASGGRTKIRLHPVAPAKVLQDSLTIMRGDVDFRRRKVLVHLSEGLPQVLGDHQRLVQVMVNLLRNAVQATKAGQTIAVEASTDHQGRVVLAVEDEGPGIPPEVRDHLFEAFFTSKGDEGMGMGLYMARLIVEDHGGEVRYGPSRLGGARFSVTLPARVEE